MADPSVVDSGEARDPGVAGALKTLREAAGKTTSKRPTWVIDAALARVETALADHKPWLEDELDECDKRADRAEARAVAAEAALADALSITKSGLVTQLLQRAEAAEAELQEERAEADDRERVIRNERNMWFEKWEAAEAERDKTRERDDWLAKQLDGCIEDARILERAKPLAIGRALIRNLEDARRAVLASEEPT